MNNHRLSLPLTMGLVVAGFLVFLTGCEGSTGQATSGAGSRAAGAPAEAPAPGSSKATLDQQIAALERKLALATERGDEIARLSALRDLLGAEETKAKADADQFHAERDQATKALDAARIAQDQARLYWFAGILGLAALIGAGLAIWLPMTARWAIRFSIACGAVAALALFVSSLLPWLWWVGAGLVAIGGAAALWYWRLDHKIKIQLTDAIEGFTADVPGWAAHAERVIDTDAEAAIAATKAHLKRRKGSPPTNNPGTGPRQGLPVTDQTIPMPAARSGCLNKE